MPSRPTSKALGLQVVLGLEDSNDLFAGWMLILIMQISTVEGIVDSAAGAAARSSRAAEGPRGPERDSVEFYGDFTGLLEKGVVEFRGSG